MGDVVQNPIELVVADDNDTDHFVPVDDESATLEEQVSLLRAEVKTLKTQQDTRGMIAWFTETAPNWHQAVVYYMTSPHEEDEEMRRTAPLLFVAGFVMLFVQTATAVSIDMGSNSVSCASGTNSGCPSYDPICNSDALRCQSCSPGNDPEWLGNITLRGKHVDVTRWRCDPRALDGSNSTLKQCINRDHPDVTRNCPYCVQPTTCALPPGTVLPEYNEYIDKNELGAFGCPSDCFRFEGSCVRGCEPVTAWQHGLQDRINVCAGCWDAATNTFDIPDSTQSSRERNYILAMGTFDWCALWLASALVALTVVAELKDTLLCKFSLQHAVEAGQDPGKAWRFAFAAHRWVRKWLFIPALVQCVPRLIGNKGGDALNVSLNTVAVLFLAEVRLHLRD